MIVTMMKVSREDWQTVAVAVAPSTVSIRWKNTIVIIIVIIIIIIVLIIMILTVPFFQFHGWPSSAGVSCPVSFLPRNRAERAASRLHNAHSPGESQPPLYKGESGESQPR